MSARYLPFSAPFLCLFCFLTFSTPILAGEKDQKKNTKLTGRIDKERRALEELNRVIEEQRKNLLVIEKEEKSIFTRLDAVSRHIQLSKNELAFNYKKLEKNRLEKKMIEGKLSLLRTEITGTQDLLSENLRNMYKKGRFSYLKILFSAKNFSDFLLKIKYARKLAENEARLIQKKKDQEEEQQEYGLAISKKERSIRDLIEKGLQKKKSAEREKKAKRKLLKDIRVKKEMFLQLKKEAVEAGEKLQKLIATLEEQKKKAVVQIQPFALKGFRLKKGALRWPVSGKIVSPFGKVVDKKFKIQSFNNGIEIRTKKEHDIKAVHRGKIIFSDWFKGYGKLIILDNGEGYYTLYGHLSEIIQNIDTFVDSGEIIGKAGDSDSVNGYTLYFEIRSDGKPLNPLKWFVPL